MDREISQHFSDQRKRFDEALKSGIINVVPIHGDKELDLLNEFFADTNGWGESSAFALAVCRNYTVATDDKTAIKCVTSKGYNLNIQSTCDIIVSMIQEKLLDVSDADQIKEMWKKDYKFALNINSFSECLLTKPNNQQ